MNYAKRGSKAMQKHFQALSRAHGAGGSYLPWHGRQSFGDGGTYPDCLPARGFATCQAAETRHSQSTGKSVERRGIQIRFGWGVTLFVRRIQTNL